jgi:hypothetical protein
MARRRRAGSNHAPVDRSQTYRDASPSPKNLRESAFRDSRKNPVLASADEARSRFH